MAGNPMRWLCDRDGCFNKKKRPKLDVFAECFRYGINFGDVDAVVERNGRFLFCEWKSAGAATTTGQRRLREALLGLGVVRFIEVFGDAELMIVARFVVHDGATARRIVDGDLCALKREIASWFEYADAWKDAPT